MTDDRDDFQRGRSQPARQRGDTAAAKRQQRGAERQPGCDTDHALNDSRSRHAGLAISGGGVDVVPDESAGRRRLSGRGGFPALRGAARLAGSGGLWRGLGGRERRKTSGIDVAWDGHDEPRMALDCRFRTASRGPKAQAIVDMRRNVLHDGSSRRTRAADARRKARFSAVLTSRCRRLQTVAAARPCFPGESSDAGQRRIMVSAPLSLLPTHAQRIAKCGSVRMWPEPLAAGPTRTAGNAGRRCVSIGKKTVRRA